MSSQQPVLGVTMGDPAGIGSEIIVRSYPQVTDRANLVVPGDLGVMEAAVDDGDSDLELNRIESVDEAAFADGVLDVVDFGNVADLQRGELRAEYGAAALEYFVLWCLYCVESRQGSVGRLERFCPERIEVFHTQLVGGVSFKLTTTEQEPMVTYRSQIGQALRVLLMLAGISGGGAILAVAATGQFSGPAQTVVFGGIVLLRLLAGALFLRITRLDDEWAYAFLTGLGVGILSSIAEALGWPSSVAEALGWPSSVAEALGWPSSVGGVITAGALVGVLTVVLFSGRMDPILDPVRQ